MRHLLCTLFMVLSCTSVWAQLPSDELPKSGSILTDIIPSHWDIMDTAFGDINRDGIGDIAFVIKDTDSSKMIENDGLGSRIVDLNPRVLGIYFGDKNGIYHQDLVSDSFIIMSDNPTLLDPFMGISISDSGMVKIDFQFFYSAGSWMVNNADYKFKYVDGRYELVSLDRVEMNRATTDFNYKEVDFVNKKIMNRRESPEDGDTDPEWSDFELDKPYTLRGIGKPFEIMFEGMFML